VKAIQELKAENDMLKYKNNELNKNIERVAEIEQILKTAVIEKTLKNNLKSQ